MAPGGPDELDAVAGRVVGSGNFDRQMEQHDLVERLLARLAPVYRYIVVLHYLQGLDCAEISTITGRPVGTIKTYLHRARAQLRADAEDLLKIPDRAS